MKNGDYIKIDLIATRKSDGKIIDTTIEKVAKEAGIFSKEYSFKPMLIILGRKEVIQGLEEKLLEMKLGEEREFDIPPQKAFGERDKNLIVTFPESEFKKQNVKPEEGKVIEVDGKRGVIKSINSGRVVVDFNHPLAGETIHYKIKIVEVLQTDEEKIKALLERYSINGDVKIKEKEIIIEVPKEADKGLNFIQAKVYLIYDIFSLFNVDTIKFVEEYAKPSLQH
ncbi:MAG: FKBP-type peptidyl-prolyl cis-trans isomerase [Candidatus Micrarchaeales archaeon]